jgi:hypothetical protein
MRAPDFDPRLRCIATLRNLLVLNGASHGIQLLPLSAG